MFASYCEYYDYKIITKLLSVIIKYQVLIPVSTTKTSNLKILYNILYYTTILPIL